ncbi:hypothetical protein [Pseudomonas sp. IT-P4]|uniref:hypothetical protein n=1 Tax=Pseudomonas sp. IT-P4 TaxID=3026446 RepID=UPI0039E12598
MKYQHNESGEPELCSGDFTKGKRASTSGPFPKNTVLSAPAKKRCTPAVAGVLASFYTSYVKSLAVLGELELKEVKDQVRIDRLKANNEYLRETAQNYSSGVSLPDWKRRLPTDTKRAFSFLGFALIPDAQAFTFRLGHEVADAALSARKGPTDHLSALMRTLGIMDLAFVTEFADSDSEENHSFHIHGVARIPAALTIQTIQELLAPKQDLKQTHPIKGYRQRGTNKAIAVSNLQTPGGWALYSAKEFDFTAHCLQSNPDYASRSATKTGRALYEAMRAWLRA